MICFACRGYPQYAARCVGAFARTAKEEVVVVATRPCVPVEGMERLSCARVVWIEATDSRPLEQLVGEMPSVLFVSGWADPAFNRFRDQVRGAGGKVIAMCDNDFRFSWKEVVKAVRFRLLLRGKFDGFFVPGKSGARLMRFYGVPSDRVRTGIYAADDSVFNDGGIDICRRPKKIVFVGQLCARKNPLRLCAAFRVSGLARAGWTLDLYGCGPLRDEIPQGDGVSVHDFAQPEVLADKYREARVFCLPSLSEHWGLVVHEAALSGCVLLLSDAIGAKDDLVGEGNGLLFPATDEAALADALRRVAGLSDERLRAASAESVARGRAISLASFREACEAFCG